MRGHAIFVIDSGAAGEQALSRPRPSTGCPAAAHLLAWSWLFACFRGDFTFDGKGSLEAFGLLCHRVRLRASGMGSVEVYADQAIDLKVSGIGSVDIRGHPKEVRRKASGIGSVDID